VRIMSWGIMIQNFLELKVKVCISRDVRGAPRAWLVIGLASGMAARAGSPHPVGWRAGASGFARPCVGGHTLSS
jgi:hypothetical protein